ncbi:flippase [bacterium]|nr:flippase [bacterium]
MSQLRKQLQNTSSLTVAKMLRPVFSFFLIKLIANTMGTEGHGQYTTVFNYIMIFEIIAAFGIMRLMTREVARDRKRAGELYVNAAMILVPVALAATGIMSGLVYVLAWEPDLMRAAWILALSLVASSLVQCSEGLLIGAKRMHIVGVVWTVENFIRVVVSILLILNGYGLQSLVLIYTALKYVMLVFYLIYIFHFLGKPPLTFRPEISRHLFRSARTFALIVIFVTVYWKLDMLMLKEMKGDVAVGIYDGAYRFFGIIIVLISNFVLSLFPAFSEVSRKDTAQFSVISLKTIKYFTVLALPFVALLIGFADVLILDIWDPKYGASVPVLIILSGAIIPYGVTEIFAHILLAKDKQRVDLLINAVGMVLNIGLNLLLIPRYSYTGAAIATVISIHFYLLIQFVYISRHILAMRFQEHRAILSGLLAAVAGIIILFIVADVLHVRFVALVTPGAFYYCVWKCGLISADDKNVIMALIRRKNKNGM